VFRKIKAGSSCITEKWSPESWFQTVLLKLRLTQIAGKPLCALTAPRIFFKKHLLKYLGTIFTRQALGSPDVLRFDFTHFAAITSEELSAIVERVNDLILDGIPVSICEMSI
jgi:hypothetical protein